MKAILLASAIFCLAMPGLAQDPGWIGVSVEDQSDRGAIIRRVEPNSPAAKAGLREGDVILEFNSEAVVGVQQLTRLVRETPIGRTVDIKVRRDNREETLKITAERATFSTFFGPEGLHINPPDVRIFPNAVMRNFPRIEMNTVHVQSGLRVESLTDQLRSFFGVTGGNGVLVTSVEAGSAAERAGLKAGDVITAVDGRSVRTPAEFSREMRTISRPVLKIFREKQEQEIKMEVDNR